jgi:hypothetical protein
VGRERGRLRPGPGHARVRAVRHLVPDGQYLLVYGYDLYVIRPDGTGRTPLDITGVPSGVFPDWIE